MPRTIRGPIDYLAGYTIIDPAPGDPPEQDYYEGGGYTVWGVGLITFGSPTAAQQAWIANMANNSDLSTFPTDWVSFGFDGSYSPGPLEIWPGGFWVAGVLINEQGIKYASAWNIEGLSGTGTFYWSDTDVSNGTNAAETLDGTAVQETLYGLGGDDTLIGGDGSDALHGGSGNDHLLGGDGVDRLWGDDGNDLLDPGSDAASLYLGLGVNGAGVHSVDGGAGTDTLVLDFTETGQSLSLEADVILSSPQVTNVEAVSITGGAFSDVLSGSSGNDRLLGGGGFDVLSGGGGNDWLDAGPSGGSSVGTLPNGGHSTADAVPLDHLFTPGTYGPNVTMSLFQREAKMGEWGLAGPVGTFYSFTVGAANTQGWLDLDYSAPGGSLFPDFSITDENGVEILSYPYGGPDVPFLFPHAGTYYFNLFFVNSNPWSNATAVVNLTVADAEILASNILRGGTGNDTYVVYSAADQIIENAGEGTDTVRAGFSMSLGANLENLTLTESAALNGTGNALNNVLLGNAAANVLNGGAGTDILAAGAGADVLIGGTGRDIYVFTASELGTTKSGPHDVISSFERGDLIDISALYEGAMFKGLKAGKAADVAGLNGFKAVTYIEAGKTYLSGDTDGIAGANFTIELTGAIKLSASDLIVNAKEWTRAAGSLDYAYHHHDAFWA